MQFLRKQLTTGHCRISADFEHLNLLAFYLSTSIIKTTVTNTRLNTTVTVHKFHFLCLS